MVLWGQSAGAASVDVLNFAYPDDPIVQGFAQDSGSVFLTIGTRSTGTTNFSSVAAGFGCSGNGTEELACLRAIPAANITAYLGENGRDLTFAPYIDEEIYQTIFGSNLNDGTILSGSGGDVAEVITLSSFQCPVPYLTAYREQLGLTTYRYQYRGNFINLSPASFLGAYHTSELPMIFGTSGDFYGADTAFESNVSVKMQDLWLAFAKDPEDGPALNGWSKSTSNEFLLLAGQDASNQTVVPTMQADSTIDDACTSYYYSYLA